MNESSAVQPSWIGSRQLWISVFIGVASMLLLAASQARTIPLTAHAISALLDESASPSPGNPQFESSGDTTSSLDSSTYAIASEAIASETPRREPNATLKTVPEPSTTGLALIGLGLLYVAGLPKRR